VEHSTGDEEGQKSDVDRSTSTDEHRPAEDTKPDEDFGKDEMEDDAVEKEVRETYRLYCTVIIQGYVTVSHVKNSHTVNSNGCLSFLVH